ncbi:MAG: hypothetical protein H6734_20285 [Alphaproteobacteria bacterium]|nr:hypothetical protein [Alphaproteobacteria bacterium]
MLFLRLLLACGPSPGEVCAPNLDRMDCNGDDALVCICDGAQDPESGECTPDEGTWTVDPFCSCSGSGIVCS